MASVRLHDIRKAFRETQILHGVSLDIADGEFLTLVGPSGCGKSTLLRIIAGLEQHDAGEVRIGERSVDHLPPKTRDVAMVFQSYALYPYMTVAENISLPLVMRRMNFWQRLPFVGRLLPGTAACRRTIAERQKQSRAFSASRSCWSGGRRSCRAGSASAWRLVAPWCATRKHS